MPLDVIPWSDGQNEPQRRRSARFSPNSSDHTKMAPSASAVKRRITVKKIAPRKTTLGPSDHNKENTQRGQDSDVLAETKKQKFSTPDRVQKRNSSSSSGKKQKRTVSVPSPIVPSPNVSAKSNGRSTRIQTRNRTSSLQPKDGVQTSTVGPKAQVQTPTVELKDQDQAQTEQPDPAALVWSQKARRSYSRLSVHSLNSPNSRLSLFGFEKLQTPEVVRWENQRENRSGLDGSPSALASFTSLLEGEECALEPDLNIPGVSLVKEKRRRRKKVQQMGESEMDEMAAKMNAEFERAEEFQLIVE
ncbi:unnamed protein product [Knipowitschia caucasica]|uniref:Cell division cycle associated 5 n=1 Tax=Knipowitschia caucasica TaxID=637954 RepID=A0AAV2K6J4_KNICA